MWLDPHTMLRRNTNGARTHKHLHVTKKLVVEGGVQKRFYDIGCQNGWGNGSSGPQN